MTEQFLNGTSTHYRLIMNIQCRNHLFQKIWNGVIFLVLDYPVCPGKLAIKGLVVVILSFAVHLLEVEDSFLICSV